MAVFKVAEIHGDKGWLFFLHIQVLNISAFFEVIEGKGWIVNVFWWYFEFVILDCEERPHAPAWVGIDFDLILDNVLDDGDIIGNVSFSPWDFEHLDNSRAIISEGHPISIYHDLRLLPEIFIHHILI